MDVQITPYCPDVRRGLIDLQRLLLPSFVPTSVHEAYFRWKYEENPYQTAPLFAVARRGSTVVGMRGIHGSRWESASYSGLVGYADNFAVATSERGTGLARTILEFATEQAQRAGFPFVLNLSAGTVTLATSMAAGWVCPGSMGPVLRLPAPSAASPRRSRWFGRRATRIAPQRARSELHRRRSASRFRHVRSHLARGSRVVVDTQPRIEEMASLVRRLPWDGRMRHVRDEVYFAWQLRNPLVRFLYLYTFGESLTGYLILQQRSYATGLSRIVDLEGESPEVRATLIRALTESGIAPHLEAWASTLEADTVSEMEQSGFVPRMRDTALDRLKPAILVLDQSSRDSGREALSRASSWDVRPLYSAAV